MIPQLNFIKQFRLYSRCDHMTKFQVGYSSIFMTEVIISQIIYGFVLKTDFEGWSWANVNNLALELGMALKFYSSVAKGLKLKVKNVEANQQAGILRFTILNRVKNDLADSRQKTIKKVKYRFHCFIVCSVEVTCIVTVIILENTFGDIKISCFYLRGNRVS